MSGNLILTKQCTYLASLSLNLLLQPDNLAESCVLAHVHCLHQQHTVLVDGPFNQSKGQSCTFLTGISDQALSHKFYHHKTINRSFCISSIHLMCTRSTNMFCSVTTRPSLGPIRQPVWIWETSAWPEFHWFCLWLCVPTICPGIWSPATWGNQHLL